MIEQLAEEHVLHAERYILPVALLGEAVAQQVEAVHGAQRAEEWSDPVPHVRGEGRAVQQYERRTRAGYPVAPDWPRNR